MNVYVVVAVEPVSVPVIAPVLVFKLAPPGSDPDCTPKVVAFAKYHYVVQKMGKNFTEKKIPVGTFGIIWNTSRFKHLKRSQRNRHPASQLLLIVAREEKDVVRNM